MLSSDACKMNDSELGDQEEEVIPISLHTLPVEIFLHICKFLDGKQMLDSLKLVCQRFSDILSDDAIWRSWMKERWPELPTSNICYQEDNIPSPEVCMQVDRGLHLFSKDQNKIKKYVDNCVHISTVDAVRLLQGGRMGVSGSRDRSLALWDTSEGLSLLQHKSGAHEGWIWALEENPEGNGLYSCSWDSNVKLWSLSQGLHEAAVFKCRAAALSLACRPGLIAAGLFTAKVELFDPRSGPDCVSGYICHNRSIMALCMLKDFVISASEDHSIAIWSLTAGKALKSGILVSREGHPMTLSFSDGNLLFVGDTESRLHVYDTNNDSFQKLESYELGHQPRGTITSMWHNPGFLLTGSKDATVRVHSVVRPPHLINTLRSSSGGVTSLDFADPVLLTGCVNNAVEMWQPNSPLPGTTFNEDQPSPLEACTSEGALQPLSSGFVPNTSISLTKTSLL